MPFQIVGTGGHRNWTLTRDNEGHRTYTILFRVQVPEAGYDGPGNALLFTPGLPVPGDPWVYGNEIDLWAHCTKEVQVAEVQDRPGAPVEKFDITFRFSTRPMAVCQDEQILDPLLEPPKISGGSVKYNLEISHDRFGYPLLTSSFELIRGPQVEFDWNRDQVRITHNAALLQHSLVTSFRDTVNAYTFWGFPPRCVKLSDFTWDVLYRGKCQVYYRRNYVFDISYRYNAMTGLIESGFDREVLDEGTKVLRGKFNSSRAYELIKIAGSDPNPNNPLHFDRYTDPKGNMTRVILDGGGLPAGAIIAGRGFIISIQNANLGHSVYDTTWWLPYYGPTNGDDPEDYNAVVRYRPGQTVMIRTSIDPNENGMYLCKRSALDKYPPTQTAYWISLDNGYTYLDGAVYNFAANYALGEVVQAATRQGSRRIEAYQESDFLLLGLPAIL